ncbi:hypothetical protein K3495_g11008 [Podosphaera aphanis]|nr:hypothetical protein K3495_g11008 [Podosphaera aphanis]
MKYTLDNAALCSREQPQLKRHILLESSIVKRKGRPKGSKNKLQQKAKSYGLSSTRRYPSLHVYEAIKPLSNPATPFTVIKDEDLSLLASQVLAIAQTDRSKWDISESYSELSTTALGITRGAGGHRSDNEAMSFQINDGIL